MDLKVSTRIGVGAVLALALVAMMAGTDASRARNSDASIVTQWNELAIHAPIGPIEAMSYVALMQLAIYDAVMAVEGGYEPFAYTGPTNPNASAEAAAATAAHRVVVQLLPGVAADAEALYATQMSAIPDGAAKTDGVAIGEADVAARARRGRRSCHQRGATDLVLFGGDDSTVAEGVEFPKVAFEGGHGRVGYPIFLFAGKCPLDL